MYSEDTIQTLINRIGFGSSTEEGFIIDIDEALSEGESKRLFKSFHALVTVDNICAAMDEVLDMTEENRDENSVKFNKVLEDFRQQAVREVVVLIMDKNAKYDASVNYDATIANNATLFDDAIGYKVAMSVLETFMSTKRSNLEDRNAKLAVGNLKLELEGYRNDGGFLVASGLPQKFKTAVLTARGLLFPHKVEVFNANCQ